MSDIPQNVPWDSMKGLCTDASQTSPRPGKRVNIVRGKHKGKVGVVTWHGENKFYDRTRYGSALSHMLGEAIGLHGFRVRIQPDDDSEAFFTNAENLDHNKRGAIIEPAEKSA